jgi:hypothetical protein
METINKYYTPETQEEVLTFLVNEKYIWSDSIQPETGKYIPITFTASLPTSLHYFLEMCNKVKGEENIEYDFISDSFRIKYLDKSDIESTGFNFIEEEDNELTFRKEISEFDYYTLTLRYSQEGTPIVIIEEWSQNKLVNKKLEKEFWSSYTLFHGEIKNISELKRILKQLNIK